MASFTGWTCSISPWSVSCSRSDVFAPGGSYPAITLTVNIQSTAGASVANRATVFGSEGISVGGLEVTDNEAVDNTVISPQPTRTLTKTHVGSFIQGRRGSLHRHGL